MNGFVVSTNPTDKRGNKIKLSGADNWNSVSCYIDSVLFAMFATLNSFEPIMANVQESSITEGTSEDDLEIITNRNMLINILRLYVSLLRSGKKITTDITEALCNVLAKAGYPDAISNQQQDAADLFNFLTEILQMPLLTLKLNIEHGGKEEEMVDHKTVKERLLYVPIPEDKDEEGPILLEDCLETYFSDKIQVKRHLRRGTIDSNMTIPTWIKHLKGLDPENQFTDYEKPSVNTEENCDDLTANTETNNAQDEADVRTLLSNSDINRRHSNTEKQIFSDDSSVSEIYLGIAQNLEQPQSKPRSDSIEGTYSSANMHELNKQLTFIAPEKEFDTGSGSGSGFNSQIVDSKEDTNETYMKKIEPQSQPDPAVTQEVYFGNHEVSKHLKFSVLEKDSDTETKSGTLDSKEDTLTSKSKSRLSKEVTLQAWSFMQLLPFYTDIDNEVSSAKHFASKNPIIVICLKRYVWSGEEFKRNARKVLIPSEINFSNFIAEDGIHSENSYESLMVTDFKLVLESAICHRGQSMKSGHFISLVADRSKGTEICWLKYDDLTKRGDKVEGVDYDKFMNEEMPYLLFYRLVGDTQLNGANLSSNDPSDSKFLFDDENEIPAFYQADTTDPPNPKVNEEITVDNNSSPLTHCMEPKHSKEIDPLGISVQTVSDPTSDPTKKSKEFKISRFFGKDRRKSSDKLAIEEEIDPVENFWWNSWNEDGEFATGNEGLQLIKNKCSKRAEHGQNLFMDEKRKSNEGNISSDLGMSPNSDDTLVNEVEKTSLVTNFFNSFNIKGKPSIAKDLSITTKTDNKSNDNWSISSNDSIRIAKPTKTATRKKSTTFLSKLGITKSKPQLQESVHKVEPYELTLPVYNQQPEFIVEQNNLGSSIPTCSLNNSAHSYESASNSSQNSPSCNTNGSSHNINCTDSPPTTITSNLEGSSGTYPNKHETSDPYSELLQGENTKKGEKYRQDKCIIV